MHETPPPTLHSPRLVLRAFVQDDAPAVQLHVSKREVADTTLNIPHPYPEGGAANWIPRVIAEWHDGKSLTLAITQKSDEALVGCIAVRLTPRHFRAEIGYWVALEQWNKGIATEAAETMVRFAFNELDVHRMEARYAVRNIASARVMQKIGMRFEGVEREVVWKDGTPMDLGVYAILKSDAPASTTISE